MEKILMLNYYNFQTYNSYLTFCILKEEENNIDSKLEQPLNKLFIFETFWETKEDGNEIDFKLVHSYNNKNNCWFYL